MTTDLNGDQKQKQLGEREREREKNYDLPEQVTSRLTPT